MIAGLLALWLLLCPTGQAAGAGAAIGSEQLLTWSRDAGMVLHPLEETAAPVTVTGVRGPVLDVVAWGGVFVAIVEVQGSQQLYRVDPQRAVAEWVADARWVQAMSPMEDGSLAVSSAQGSFYRVTALTPEGSWWSVAEDLKDAEPFANTSSRTEEMRPLAPLGLVSFSSVALYITDPEQGATVQGVAPHPLRHVGRVSSGRLVSVDQGEERMLLTRWSLLHPWAPWPFPLGSTPLPAEVIDLVTLPDGVWVLGPTPFQPIPPVPGVVYGMASPDAPVIAAELWQRPDQPLSVVLVNRDLSYSLVAPPALPDRSPPNTGDGTRLALGDWLPWASTLGQPDARARAMVRALREDDLPVGMDSPGGSLPEWGRTSVQQLLSMASPLNQVPIVVARAYVERFDDPNGELSQALQRKQTELRAATVSFWGALMVVGGLLTWLWRWGHRRVRMRDRVLAAAYNPFRQDSPNNPARTPFAANSLVDDLLRTLDLNCAVVEAPQFSGKSALLRHLAWRLENEGLRGQPVRVVKMGLYAIPEERFWTELGQRIAAVYPECEASEEVLELSELDRGAVEYLLDEALIEGSERLVLVLDDLDAMGLYQHEAQRFRGLLQVVPSHRMSVLGAGLSIRRGFAGAEDESPWFNIFQVRHLQALSFDELTAYLDTRLDSPFSFQGDAAARIHSLTEGRPLQVWHLCFSAVEQLLISRRLVLRVQEVDDAADELRALAGVFDSNRDGQERVASEPQELWEQVVGEVAAARRLRAELLQSLAERQQLRQDQAIEDFFRDEGA